MSRKTGSTHSHDAAFADALKDLICGEGFRISAVKLCFFVLLVVLDNNGLRHCSRRCKTSLNPFHSAGYRGVERHGNKSIRIGDLLSRQNVIALLHAGNRRSSDMLGQGIYHFAFRQIFFDGAVFRQLFAVIGMHTALEGKLTHMYFLLNHKRQERLCFLSLL